MKRRSVLLVALTLTAGLLLLADEPCTIIVQPGESIQGAIDAAPEGAVICLVEGEWEENITIEKSLTLRGEGAERSVIRAKEKSRPAVGIRSPEGAEAVQVVLENLTVTGAVESAGVFATGNAQVTIHGSTVSRNGWYGILVLDLAQAAITECTVSGNEWGGIVLRGSAQATITKSTVSRNEMVGVVLRDSAQATITGSTILGENKGFGILLMESAQATITGSTVSKTGAGIELEDSAQVSITDSTVSENKDVGILLEGTAQATITGSTISKNREGIMLRWLAQATITKNTVSKNAKGIELTDSVQATISGNVIEGNSLWGILSMSTGEVHGEKNVMRDNGVDLVGNLPGTLRLPLLEPSEAAILFPDGRYPTLQHAVDALLPKGRLILQEGEYEAGLTITKELVIAAQEGAEVVLRPRSWNLPVFSLVGGAKLSATGLKVTGGSVGFLLGADVQATIHGSTVSGNSHGIQLRGSAQVTITGSIVSENVRGIELMDSAQATITGSTVSENIFGIELSGTAQATLIGSTISGNNYGILLKDSAQATIEENRIFGNHSYGVALYVQPCFAVAQFTGYVTGKGNIGGGNAKSDYCPETLAFLFTEEGGELDQRSQSQGP